MAPPSWATDDQSTLLTSYLPLYETYQSTTRKYQPFWDMINAAFLKKWPILPPGANPNDLGEDELQDYTQQLAKLYDRIKYWYRWRCSPRARNTATTVTSKEMKDIYAPGTRNPKEYEIFVKQNPDLFQPLYEAECIRQGSSGAGKLAIWHKVAGEVWDNATEEQKAAVQAQLIATKEANAEDAPDPSTPSEYQKYWEKLPAILSKTVTPAVRKAGVLAFVTVVGPVPNAGGQILATTLQFGDKPDTPLFSNTWADHDRVLVDQLANFAGRYEFPPEVCTGRSLLHVQKAEDGTSDASGSRQGAAGAPATSEADNSAGGSISASGSSPDDATPSGSSASSSSSQTDCATGQSQSKATSTQSSSTVQFTEPPSQALTTAVSPVTLSDSNTSILINDTHIDPLGLGLNNGSLTDLMDAENLENFDWASAEVLEMIMRANAVDPLASPKSSVEAPNVVHAPDPNGNTTSTKIVPDGSAIAPPFHAPVLDPTNMTATMAPTFYSPGLNAAANAPHTLHAPVSNAAADAPFHTPVPASDGSVVTPSSQVPVSSTPTTLPAVHAAAVNASTASPLTGEIPTLNTAPPVVHAPAINAFATVLPMLHAPAPNMSSTFQGSAPITPAAERPTSHAPILSVPATAPSMFPAPAFNTPVTVPPTFNAPAPATVVTAPSPFQIPASNTPAAVPSTFNAPASTTGATPLTFQIPGFNTSAAPPPPSQAPNLNIDYPKNFQGASPFHDLENGVRRSTRAPVPSTRIDKLNEIGDNTVPPKPPTASLADAVKPSWFDPAYDHLKRSNLGKPWTDLVEKWAEYERIKGWRSGKGLPAKGRPEEWTQWLSKARHGVRKYQKVPNVEDPLELGITIVNWVKSFSTPDFGRTGPHGIVSLLTLLVWWGTAALTPSSWNDDSRPQWQSVVQDLLGKFHQHLNTPLAVSSLNAKRDREDNSLDNKENKRPRNDLGL